MMRLWFERPAMGVAELLSSRATSNRGHGCRRDRWRSRYLGLPKRPAQGHSAGQPPLELSRLLGVQCAPPISARQGPDYDLPAYTLVSLLDAESRLDLKAEADEPRSGYAVAGFKPLST